MHRKISAPTLALLLGLVISLLLPTAASAADPPRANPTQEVRELIETYGPQMVYHPDEAYFLDTPEAVLNGPSRLYWGIIQNEDDPALFQQEILGWVETSADTLMADVATAKQDPRAVEPGFRYWLDIDPSLRSGHLPRAKTMVRVWPEGDLQLDLQFWFFSPYNGPVKGKAQVNIPGVPPTYYFSDTVGRHSGDWEHVVLRFTRQDAGQDWTLDQLFLSQHSGGQWIDADDSSLRYAGTHPIIYAAKDSHAYYATTGEHPFQRVLTYPLGGGIVLTVDLVDLVADGGKTFAAYRPGNYRIVSSALPGVTPQGERDWLEFDGPWGAYEVLSFTGEYTLFGMTREFTFAEVGNGPSGPAQKPAWTGQYD